MADIKNLDRLGQIAKELPKYEQARKMLSGDKAGIIIKDDKGAMEVPTGIKYNILAALNANINILKEELKKL